MLESNTLAKPTPTAIERACPANTGQGCDKAPWGNVNTKKAEAAVEAKNKICTSVDKLHFVTKATTAIAKQVVTPETIRSKCEVRLVSTPIN